jgi:glucose-6-phosphate dehydrogenase assembly protein OpcA
MTTTLWDTTGSDIVKALIAERRAGGSVASGLAVTFVAVVDEKHIAAAEQAATIAAQAHACRLLMVIRRQVDTSDRLDAEVQVGGRLGPIEAVVMRMYGRLALHAESIVLPLLAPDAPVVTWWYGAPPDAIATDPLGVLADRRITDCALAPDPMAALRHRAADFAPGDTDLAWTRTTPWRSLLASAFDASAAEARSARISAEEGNPSAALLAGWLSGRLGVPAEVVPSRGPGITEVEMGLVEGAEKGTLRIDRPDGRLATFSRSGQPDRQLPLLRRQLGDLLAEELRRLEVDEVYAEALEESAGIPGLSKRSPLRTHIWRDPALASEIQA